MKVFVLILKYLAVVTAFMASASLLKPLSAAETTAETATEKSINVVLNVLPSIKPAFLPIFKQFELESGIKVIPQKFIEDDDFDKKMHQWLVEGKNTPDVLYGHNNMRLLKMAQIGVVHPVSHLWQKNDWFSKFRQEQINGLTFENEQYALPYSLYTWGLFYNKSITKKLGAVPQTWQAFKAYCQQLKNLGISPFPASKKQPYIAAAWFEYLVLRIHGLALFNQIMLGEIAFTDQRIQQVFIEWQDLINRGFYDTSYYKMRWEQYLPYFLRNKIGFVLMGSPLGSRIFNEDLKQKVEFMPFPKISDIPKYETAPSNIFFIAANSKKINYSEQFLEFISQVEIQSQLNSVLQTSPARIGALTGNDKYAQQGIASIDGAQGLSPFFDRGAEPEFERKAVISFAKFLKTGDIKQLTNELETLRLIVYTDKHLTLNH